MRNYQLIIDGSGSQTIQAEDESGRVFFIPNDPGNSDYQRYLRWLENPEAESASTLS